MLINESFYYSFLPGVGPGELFLVFLVVLLVFGPKKLPEIGKAFGEAIGEFKKASNNIKDSITDNNQK